MMNAVKYTFDVKTKTMNFVEYKNSVEKTEIGWILKKDSSPIRSGNMGRICAELAHVENGIKKPYILAIVLLEDSADTHMEWAKKAFEEFDYKDGFSMLYE